MLTINVINLYISIVWILNKCCTHHYIRRDVKFCFLRGLAHCSLISITDCRSESENTTPNQFYVNFKLSRLSLRQTLLQWLQDTFSKYQSRKMSLPIFFTIMELRFKYIRAVCPRLKTVREFLPNRFENLWYQSQESQMISNDRDSFAWIKNFLSRNAVSKIGFRLIFWS